MKLTCLLISLITCCITCRAQLCTGSLGDPVIHITFGSGANPGPPLAAATTFYTYNTGDCPNDGSYIIRSTLGCPGWYLLNEDHTPGDVNGYFMFVNASYQPGDFYLDTIKGLCGSTTYEFAAWVMNVLQPNICGGNGIDPNLTF